MLRLTMTTRAIAVIGAVAAWALSGIAAHAEKIPNGVAVFAALDKVTARISRLEVKIDETKDFGALKITPRACFTRPPTEPPKTTSFVEVREVKLDGSEDKIFGGWMFAQSPGLNAVQHPVFDVWLTDCTAPAKVAATADAPAEGTTLKKKRRAKRN